jgi:hypothetical protein
VKGGASSPAPELGMTDHPVGEPVLRAWDLFAIRQSSKK